MSVAKLWQDMYSDAVRRERSVRDDLHQQRLKLILAESQRIGLLGLLELAAKDLQEAKPGFAKLLLDRVTELRNSYEPQEILPTLPLCEARRVGGPVSGHSGDVRSAPVHTEAGSTVAAPF